MALLLRQEPHSHGRSRPSVQISSDHCDARSASYASPCSPLTWPGAVDTTGVDSQRIDTGWNPPVSLQEIADISGRLPGHQIRVAVSPPA
jgi:hypothetical protein